MSQVPSAAVRRWISDIGRRILSMVAAWLCLGAFVGLSIGYRQNAGPVGFFSFAVAGMVVFLIPGVCLGFVLGHAKRAFVGGVVGMLLGAVAATSAGNRLPAEIPELCLVVGAIAGVTLLPYCTAMLWMLKLVGSWSRSHNVGPAFRSTPSVAMEKRGSAPSSAISKKPFANLWQ